MRLRQVIEHGALELHVLDCACGDEDCTNVLIMGRIAPKPYWATLSIVPESMIDGQVQEILANAYLVAHAVALLGVKRVELEERSACIRQMNVWLACPDWLFRVPIETVWEVRRKVFGDNFTRTIRALQALDKYVPDLPEGPVPAPSMEALIGRQMKVAYEPRGMS